MHEFETHEISYRDYDTSVKGIGRVYWFVCSCGIKSSDATLAKTQQLAENHTANTRMRDALTVLLAWDQLTPCCPEGAPSHDGHNSDIRWARQLIEEALGGTD